MNGPAQVLDHQHRRDTARRQLHDDTLKPEDRLAGLLVLPVAPLARTVVANRKGHATIGATTPSLLPGRQPGQPISTQQLTQRLNNLGIHPSQARSTAVFQLATADPAAILARTLGIHTDVTVTVTWQRHSRATGPPQTGPRAIFDDNPRA